MRNTSSLDRGLLVIRIALGLVFVAHGGQKLFVFGLDGVPAFLTQAGFPFPVLNAAAITGVELLGGLALLVGLATRAAAALTAVSMLVAILTVHLASGFFLPNGYEYPLTLMLVSVGLVLSGAGAYSLDARLRGAGAEAESPTYRLAA
ncbi:MAG: DoxX family protein [Acidobacteria bacterium]|nr:DoxX family protein [Acidobacteriota bacterium]